MRMKMKGAGTMNITDVRVRKVAKEGKMKAVVSITIDEEFVVHDIKVIEGEKSIRKCWMQNRKRNWKKQLNKYSGCRQISRFLNL